MDIFLDMSNDFANGGLHVFIRVRLKIDQVLAKNIYKCNFNYTQKSIHILLVFSGSLMAKDPRKTIQIEQTL